MFSFLIAVIFIVANIVYIKKVNAAALKRVNSLSAQYSEIMQKQIDITSAVNAAEIKITRQFAFYDIIRKIDPILDKTELINTFVEEMRRANVVSDVCLANFTKEGYLSFTIRGDEEEMLLVKPKEEYTLEYMPVLADILALCLERISLYERLQRLSIYDSLTSIYNRRYFFNRCAQEVVRAGKNKLPLSILVIDLDYFKKINDQYGHLVGDVVLAKSASLIKDSIREVDFAARLGGEEFAVVLSETARDGALMVAERIRSRIANEKIKAFDEVVQVTASIGVAFYGSGCLAMDALIETADKRLYQAKQAGRNRVVFA